MGAGLGEEVCFHPRKLSRASSIVVILLTDIVATKKPTETPGAQTSIETKATEAKTGTGEKIVSGMATLNGRVHDVKQELAKVRIVFRLTQNYINNSPQGPRQYYPSTR